jgi:hypothetical protein
MSSILFITNCTLEAIMDCHVLLQKEFRPERMPTDFTWKWFVLEENFRMSLGLQIKFK